MFTLLFCIIYKYICTIDIEQQKISDLNVMLVRDYFPKYIIY